MMNNVEEKEASKLGAEKSDSIYTKWFKPEEEEELKMSANAARKAKIHSQRVIAMLYCIVLLSIGLSISLYCTGSEAAESKPTFVWFFTLLYVTSSIGMVYMLLFVWIHRNASIEAVENGDLSAPRILFSMRGEPVSLYLRIGFCIFAAMAVVFSVFRAREANMNGAQLERILPYTVSKVLFFLIQPLFLLILHRLVVLSNVRRFSFILLHLLTVSLCVWVESVIDKISRTMSSEHENLHVVSPIDYHIVQATGYFLPAIPEYCAISVAVIYEMSQRIGQIKQIEAHHEHNIKSERKKQCKDYTGIVFASTIVLFILAVILFLENAGPSINSFRTIFHLTELSVIQVLALILSILGVVLIRRLKFSVNFAKNSLDEKLLLVTFFITVNFFCVALMLCIGYLVTGKLTDKYRNHVSSQLVAVLLELLQIIAQTYFIHDMFYRCCHHEAYQEKKPGRTAITILASLNFSLWMIYSFQFKHNGLFFKEPLKHIAEKHDLRALNIFISAMLPMVMLFRYHSSVCLAISYTRVYEDEVTRYENMLRWVKQDTNKTFLYKQKTSLGNIWSTFSLTSPKAKRKSQGEIHLNGKLHVQPQSQGSLLNEDFASAHSRNSDGAPITSELAHEKHKKRRDTKVNIEMARIRLAASEENHRKAEMKLRLQKMKERLCAQSIRDVIDENEPEKSVSEENVSRN